MVWATVSSQSCFCWLYRASPSLTAQKHAGCDRLCRSMAERSYPSPKVRGCGWEELPHIQGVAVARAQEGQEELLHVQGQEGQREEIPLIQGKRPVPALCWSGCEEIPHVQGRRNPSKTVDVERDIRGQTHWNHYHRKLGNLITRTTALSNSMKLSQCS